MSWTALTVPINGTRVALGPFAWRVRSVTVVNKCGSGNLVAIDDQGQQYVAAPETANTFGTYDTTHFTAYMDAANTVGSAELIVSDQEPTSPVANSQLASLAPQVASGTVVVSGTNNTPVSTAGTTFATGADLLAGDLAFAADGITTYLLEVSARGWVCNTVGQFSQLAVKLDGVESGIFALTVLEAAPAVAQTLNARSLVLANGVTPPAGNHTINARMFVSGGGATGSVAAGNGIGGNDVPILVSVRAL